MFLLRLYPLFVCLCIHSATADQNITSPQAYDDTHLNEQKTDLNPKDLDSSIQRKIKLEKMREIHKYLSNMPKYKNPKYAGRKGRGLSPSMTSTVMGLISDLLVEEASSTEVESFIDELTLLQDILQEEEETETLTSTIDALTALTGEDVVQEESGFFG